MHYKVAETKTCYRAAAKCISTQCMAWRWLPLIADKLFIEAVALAERQGKGKTTTGVVKIGLTHEVLAGAARYVVDNRAEYGLPTEPFEGYCGPCGKP